MSDEQALVPLKPSMAMQPQTFEEAKEFARIAAQSALFLPKDMRGKPHDVLLAVLQGAELGMPAIQSLQNICVIQGVPSLYTKTKAAIVQAHPLCEDYAEVELPNNTGWEVTIKRRGRATPFVGRFTIDDAKRAQLWGKSGPWTQYPQDMLRARARGRACDAAFGDALKGIASAEVQQDIHATEPEVLPPVEANKNTPEASADEVWHMAADLMRRMQYAVTERELLECTEAAARLPSEERAAVDAEYEVQRKRVMRLIADEQPPLPDGQGSFGFKGERAKTHPGA